MKMCRNAAAALFCSRGVSMFLAGDEFANTQFGNNNAYCQDNEISWLDWKNATTNKDLLEFFEFMISFRKSHPVLRCKLDARVDGLPDTLFLADGEWGTNINDYERVCGVVFAGNDGHKDHIVCVVINAYWEKLVLPMPELPAGLIWRMVADTSLDGKSGFGLECLCGNGFEIEPRSTKLFEAIPDADRWDS